jgi:hypothetical protein
MQRHVFVAARHFSHFITFIEFFEQWYTGDLQKLFLLKQKVGAKSPSSLNPTYFDNVESINRRAKVNRNRDHGKSGANCWNGLGRTFDRQGGSIDVNVFWVEQYFQQAAVMLHFTKEASKAKREYSNKLTWI